MADLDEACCSEEMATPPSLMHLCEHVLASLLNRGTLIPGSDLSRILATLCVKFIFLLHCDDSRMLNDETLTLGGITVRE